MHPNHSMDKPSAREQYPSSQEFILPTSIPMEVKDGLTDLSYIDQSGFLAEYSGCTTIEDNGNVISHCDIENAISWYANDETSSSHQDLNIDSGEFDDTSNIQWDEGFKVFIHNCGIFHNPQEERVFHQGFVQTQCFDNFVLCSLSWQNQSYVNKQTMEYQLSSSQGTRNQVE